MVPPISNIAKSLIPYFSIIILMKLTVLRLGHRIKRDKRLTTHVCLTSRALGADDVILSGDYDESIMNSVKDIIKRWGGKFKVSYEKNWKSMLKDKEVIHLTMYGIPIQKSIQKIRSSKKDKIIVVGGEKVPAELYEMADYNIAVTNQPHSEVAALAIFLDNFFQGKELENKHSGAQIKVHPQKKGKKVQRKERIFSKLLPF